MIMPVAWYTSTRWMDDSSVQPSRRRWRPVLVLGEHVEQRQRGELGGEQPSGQGLLAQRAAAVAEEVERPDVPLRHRHGQREHRGDAGVEKGLRERRPAGVRRSRRDPGRARGRRRARRPGTGPRRSVNCSSSSRRLSSPLDPNVPRFAPSNAERHRRPVDLEQPDAGVTQLVGSGPRAAGARHRSAQLGPHCSLVAMGASR
jgi:hypothetical protein